MSRGAALESGRGRSPAAAAWRRLVASPAARAGLVIAVAFALIALVTPFVHVYDARTDADLTLRLKPPMAGHPFGTDSLGRDILVRVLHATRVSLGLAVSAVAVATLIGSVLGFVAGYFRRQVDLVVMFCMDIVLAWFFGVQLRVLPTGFRLGSGIALVPWTNFALLDAALQGDWPALVDALRHLILPTLALATIPLAIIARMTRASMLEVLSREYVRTAEAKGLSRRAVILRHALRNALLPVLTVIGLQVGHLLAGAILTETIFSWPGIGLWVYESIESRDYAIVQGVTLFIAVIVVGVNLLTDVLYAAVDPRIKYE